MGPAPAVAQVRRAVRAVLSATTFDGATLHGSAQPVLVACSGGADSLALAAATAFEAARAGIPAGLITVDHGLQSGSAAQAERVAALGYELGLDPVTLVRVQVGDEGGPEASARTARYAALDAAAAALDARLLLGHTLDDQAETVLLGLGRGSGPRSLAGMRVVDGHRVRPFLGLRRSVTEAACAALGLPVWDDPHNVDPVFQRVRLRREVLPLLEDVLHDGVAPALARTAELLRDDLAALDSWGADVLESMVGADGTDGASLDVDALTPLPRAVRTRVLRAWATHGAGHGPGPLSAERTAALDALVVDWHGQGPIELPGGAAVSRASGRLHLAGSREPDPAPPTPRENRV